MSDSGSNLLGNGAANLKNGLVVLFVIGLSFWLLFFKKQDKYAMLKTQLQKLKETVRSRVRPHPQHSERPRHYHAIVNPASGNRQGKKTWKEMKALIADVDPDAVVNTLYSKHEGHERDIAAALANSDDVEEGDVVIVIGGDGFLFEIVDELVKCSNDSTTHLFDHPLCIVPAGTGNGVATSLKFMSAAHSAEAMLTSEPGSFNLMRVVLDDEKSKPRHSALSIGWGAIADHDYYSEGQCRWMGEARLLIVPMGIIGYNKTYRGRITFTPHSSQDLERLKPDGVKTEEAEDGKLICTVEDDYFIVHVVNVPWMASDSLIAPDSRHDDDCMHILVCRAISRIGALKLFLQFSDGRHEEESPEVSIYRATDFKLEPLDASPTMHNFAIDGQCVSAHTVSGSTVEKGLRMFHATV